MLCSVYTTIAGEYYGPGFCTPIGCLLLIPSCKNDNEVLMDIIIQKIGYS